MLQYGLEAALISALLIHVLYVAADLKQLRVLQSLRSAPPLLAGELCGERLAKIRRYSLGKWRHSFLRRTCRLGETLIILGSGALPRLWTAAGHALPRFTARWGEPAQAAALALLALAAATAVELPWHAYSTFVVEARSGLNRTTPAVFLADTARVALIAGVAVPSLAAAAAWALSAGGLWVALLAVAATAGLFALPRLIAPLFNRFDPLPPCSLRGAVEQAARSLGFPVAQVYLMDGSKRSAHPNAWVHGALGTTRRIVLTDTLTQTCTEEEAAALVAHELGHHKLHHPLITFAMALAAALALPLASAAVTAAAPGVLHASFGFPHGAHSQPRVLVPLLMYYSLAPVWEALRVASLALSRRFYLSADAFAVATGRGAALRSALVHLEGRGLAAPVVDPLWAALFCGRPPLVARLTAIDAALGGADKKAS